MEYRDIIQRVWSDWSIGEKLGEGSFGQVYFVQKERLGVIQKAAVKVVRIPTSDAEVEEIKAAYGLAEEQLKEFFYPEVLKYKEEIQLMQTLGENANIVQVQDFEIIEDPSGRLGWYILIRMELLESLDSFIKREKLSVGDVTNMAMDILEGLQECENHNIIHRDIKTANLFRSKKGIYKLGDFGIARDTSASSRSLSHKGTDNYMAPEVYQGKRYSHNVDLYALGIVIYKLLNKNRLPFLGEERLTSRSIERAFQLRQQGEEIPRALECSEELHNIIKKMCAYNPEDRYQSAQEVLRDLNEYQMANENELNIVLNLPKYPNARNIFDMEICANISRTDNSTARNVSLNRDVSGNTYEESRSRENSYGDYTRQIYQKREQLTATKNEGTVQPNIQQVLEEANQPPTKKTSSWMWIMAVCVGFLVIAGVIFENSSSVKSQKEAKDDVITDTSGSDNSKKEDKYNDIRVAKVKEIAEDSDLFEIDKDRLDSDMYIDYSLGIFSYKSNTIKDRDGFYIGELKNGIPDGYGVFYYKVENNDDGSKAWGSFMLLGEWKQGNLKSSSIVERRFIAHIENAEDDISVLKYTFSDNWEDNWFVHDEAEGTYSYQDIARPKGKMWDEWTFTGKVEVNGIGCIRGTRKYSEDSYEEGEFENLRLVKGKKHFRDGDIWDGEFQDGILYNGTVYNADGSIRCYYENGEYKSADR